MSARSVEVDGQLWQDGWVGVDLDGKVWRLFFLQSTWGPEKDAWVWHEFGVEVDYAFDAEVVKRPLTKVWPPEVKPAVKRRADSSNGRQA